jgi:hypothetical protein
MTQKDLQELLDRDPFQPLKVTLSSGETIEIADPARVVAMRNQFFVALPDERYKLVWLRHVVSVEGAHAA